MKLMTSIVVDVATAAAPHRNNNAAAGDDDDDDDDCAIELAVMMVITPMTLTTRIIRRIIDEHFDRADRETNADGVCSLLVRIRSSFPN